MWFPGLVTGPRRSLAVLGPYTGIGEIPVDSVRLLSAQADAADLFAVGVPHGFAGDVHVVPV